MTDLDRKLWKDWFRGQCLNCKGDWAGYKIVDCVSCDLPAYKEKVLGRKNE